MSPKRPNTTHPVLKLDVICLWENLKSTNRTIDITKPNCTPCGIWLYYVGDCCPGASHCAELYEGEVHIDKAIICIRRAVAHWTGFFRKLLTLIFNWWHLLTLVQSHYLLSISGPLGICCSALQYYDLCQVMTPYFQGSTSCKRFTFPFLFVYCHPFLWLLSHFLLLFSVSSFLSLFVCRYALNSAARYSPFPSFLLLPCPRSIHPLSWLTGRVCCFYQSDIGSLPRARPGNSQLGLMAPQGPAPTRVSTV